MPVPWVDDRTVYDWDNLFLAGEWWPGLSRLKSKVGRDIDKKKAKGADAATLTDNGYKLAEIEVEIFMWEASQWEEFQRLLPLIHPRRKGAVTDALAILHPAATIFGVEYVLVEEISGPEPDGLGGLTVTLSMTEWVAKPSPKAGTGAPKKKDTAAKTEAEREREQLLNEVNTSSSEFGQAVNQFAQATENFMDAV